MGLDAHELCRLQVHTMMTCLQIRSSGAWNSAIPAYLALLADVG